MKQELVKDWMTRNIVAITPDSALPEAHRLMTEKRIRRLLVVQDGLLVGLVTLGDVRGAEPSGATSLSMWEMNYLLGQVKIAEIMNRDLITISPNATIEQAARLMLEYKISGLPVIDYTSGLVGIITESDIFRMVVQGWRQVDIVEPELQTVGCLQ